MDENSNLIEENSLVTKLEHLRDEIRRSAHHISKILLHTIKEEQVSDQTHDNIINHQQTLQSYECNMSIDSYHYGGEVKREHCRESLNGMELLHACKRKHAVLTTLHDIPPTDAKRRKYK